MTTTDNSDISASNSISQLSEPIIDASINFVLNGLNTGVNLFENIDFTNFSSEILYHHFIAKQEIMIGDLDYIFWFRCPSGSFIIDDLVNENNDEVQYAIISENWKLNLSYSNFKPDSGIDLSYNVIGENIDLYHDKDTIANIGVNRLARQVAGNITSSNIFENKDNLLKNYTDLDVSINNSIKIQLQKGGIFDKPLLNSNQNNVNITRCLLETFLKSEINKLRIEELINNAFTGKFEDKGASYPWVPLKFKVGDKLRHILTYNVESIVMNYSNNNIVDPINGLTSNQYPDIIYGGNCIDMSNCILTDQQFLIEYHMI